MALTNKEAEFAANMAHVEPMADEEIAYRLQRYAGQQEWRNPSLIRATMYEASQRLMADTIIDQPGKFEGERRIIQWAYDYYLQGFADNEFLDDDFDTEISIVTLHGQTVRFIETSDGFVTEVK